MVWPWELRRLRQLERERAIPEIAFRIATGALPDLVRPRRIAPDRLQDEAAITVGIDPLERGQLVIAQETDRVVVPFSALAELRDELTRRLDEWRGR